MARTLPWSKKPETTKRALRRDNGQVKPEPERPVKRARRISPPLPPPPLSDAHPVDHGLPSSSPPISPVGLKPPPEDYMIEGLDNDDQYIMVEDEFLHTAQLFTRHLHQAEYDRIKKRLEKDRRAGFVNQTDPTLKGTHTAVVSHANASTTKKIEERTDQSDEDGGSQDDLWAGTVLHSLMTGPAAPPPSLAAIHSSQTFLSSPSRRSQRVRRKPVVDRPGSSPSARPVEIVPSDDVSTASEEEYKEIAPIRRSQRKKMAKDGGLLSSSPALIRKRSQKELSPISEEAASSNQTTRPQTQQSSISANIALSSSPRFRDRVKHDRSSSMTPHVQSRRDTLKSDPPLLDDIDSIEGFTDFVRNGRSVTGSSQASVRDRDTMLERREKRKREEERKKALLDEVPTFFM